MARKVGSWEGGRVAEKSDGTRVYYIRKRIGGKLYEVSTGATTLKAALSHWQRFQANPEAYDPSGALPGKALTIRAFLKEYLDFCRDKGNSKNWVTQKRRYLRAWSESFPGDVRTLTREKLLGILAAETVPHNRLASLKAFCSWLRDVKGLLPKAEDVTLDVAIPAPQPAQWTAPRAISREVYKKTLEKLDPTYTDIVVMIAGTGMHTTEALRLAQGKGTIHGNILTVFHKGGRQHRMEVEQDVAEAARRVQLRGGFSVSRLQQAVRDACDAAGVERWQTGGLRHSFVTWMVGDGATLEAVAAYTNHDVSTLRKYYNIAPIPRPAIAKTG